MAKEKHPQELLGDGKCHFCGHPVKVKSNTGGHVYAFCPKDGGCGIGVRSTAAKGDAILKKGITKSRKPKEASESSTDETGDTAAPKKKKGFDWDKEIF